MPGVRKEIPKEETFHKYGGEARKGGIDAIGKRGFYENTFRGDSGWGSLIEGRFVYAVGNKPISAGRAKTGAYVDEYRKQDARFFVTWFQEFAESNASAPTVPLQSIRLCLAVIAYRMWNFRVMDVSRAFSMSEPLKRNT